MKKLIELDAALKAIGRVPDYGDGMVFEALSHAQLNVELLPTVDAAPVRHGHWVKWYEEVCDSFGVAYVPHCKCSECGREYDPYDANHMNYCFECGAKIDGKDGDNHG